MGETIVIYLAVLLAVLYLLRRKIKNTSKGCGRGCGCSEPAKIGTKGKPAKPREGTTSNEPRS